MAFTGGQVLAWVAFTWVNGYVTALASVTGFAEAGVVSNARFVLAHGTVRAWAALAVGLFDLAVDAGVALFTFAPV